MLAAETSLREDLESLGELKRGELTLGIPPLGATFLGPAIAAFHRQWPGVEIKLIESSSRAVEAALRSGELEVGIFLAPVTEVLDFISICDHPVHLLAPRASRWKGRKTVALAELAEEVQHHIQPNCKSVRPTGSTSPVDPTSERGAVCWRA